MKTVLLLFISCLSLNTNFAQLTNAQVYNFAVGDVFQVKYDGPGVGPKPIETDTVIAKYYSSGMDSLFYIMNHLEYVGSFMQNPPIYNYYIDTVIITNLNALANHFNYFNSCRPTSDTVMISSCGFTFERLHSNHADTCFEPPIWYSDLYPGLGGPYYYMYDPSLFGTGQEWYSKTLNYYHSNQHGECGTYQSVASLNDFSLDFEVNIFPVPATSEIQIEAALPITDYAIYSMNGLELLQNEKINSSGKIDLSSLQAGGYLLQISSSDRVKKIKFIKQ